MLDTPSVIAVALFAFIVGGSVIKLVEFFFIVDRKDDRDELIERAQKFTDELQNRLASLKDKTQDAQYKYVQCQSELTELQIKYDEKCSEIDELKRKHES
jgi:peptidoglycan hydrolase CwlO-like protein